MKTDRKYIETIVSANNDNSLAIFVGSGISKSSESKGIKLPSWADLIEEFKVELEIDNESDFLKIAQLYHLAFGEYTYYQKIKSYFPDHIPPSVIHKLIFDIYPHVIITTNWDNLLEKTIQENTYLYDVISSDNDLVKSSLQNKLIKMHGDFKNHNIVFREDDYINYNRQFPLIENYVKSILSTHTVLFLGYSYNDINLKHIVKWIRNYSTVKPPMYLVTYNRNDNQIKYLENHGITTLILEEIDYNKIPENLASDDYSKKMLTFLSRILTKDEMNVAKNLDEIINYLLEKLNTLNELEGILVEQIQNALTNCGFFIESDSLPILEFYGEPHFDENSKWVREMYAQFIEFLKESLAQKRKIPDKVLQIFEILRKARIKGIMIPQKDSESHEKKYLKFGDFLALEDSNNKNDYLNFDFKTSIANPENLDEMFESAYKLYNLDKVEDSFALIEKVIKICMKQRNYAKLFIAMLNRDILLQNLKFGIYSYDKNEKYKKIEKYNLKELYYNLPKDMKFALEPIYEFVNFSFIYRYAYSISKESKSLDSKQILFDNNIDQMSSKHENLVNFVLMNKIMIENFDEYKSINASFVKIALEKYSKKEIFTLSKTELYTCIKCIEYKELRLLLTDFYKKDSPKIGKLVISEPHKEWLIKTVLENITTHFINSNHGNIFEKYIQNTTFILSLLKNEVEDSKNILTAINKILKEGKNTLIIFESINFYLGIQHNLFNLEIDKEFLISMIETLIEKLVCKNLTGLEHIALTRNELSNLYGYAIMKEVVFENEGLIEKLISEVKTYSTKDKIEITQNFILRIYEISNVAIKEKIKEFALSIDTFEEVEVENRILFENTLVIYNFKSFSAELKKVIEVYLEQYKDGRRFSSLLFSLDSQIDFLISNVKEKGLEDISEILKSAINQYLESKRSLMF
ncbi:SIR2 family protein [Leptospira paudalimensis]|uniref:SIR2 family protein n=1 Tax=Leptospira paudalimensis TaxID=2950024 RepID=A0ABT3M692_9LEPT|nr:SIR2 family protein [Leptospira paudalimensis]MCW7503893.1 SIR2 family protein [Leptospira paudalimensis]